MESSTNLTLSVNTKPNIPQKAFPSRVWGVPGTPFGTVIGSVPAAVVATIGDAANAAGVRKSGHFEGVRYPPRQLSVGVVC